MIKCAAAFTIIIVLVTGKVMLEMNGTIASGNIAVGAVMMFATIGLAILGGTASLDFTRSGNEIRDICSRTGISKQDILEYEKG